MEALLPEFNDYLIKSNDDVIAGHNREWVLYYYMGGAIHSKALVFTCSDQLMHEAQDYLMYLVSLNYGQDDSFVRYIARAWRCISTAIDILDNTHTKKLTSILELRILDVQLIQAKLAQQTKYESGTQKQILLYLQSFYNYVRRNSPEVDDPNPFNNIKIPSANGQTVTPVSKLTLDTIHRFLDSLPEFVALALLLVEITGGRANSIYLLTTDAILYNPSTDKYAIDLINYKTRRQRAKKGQSEVTIKHDLPDWYAKSLLAFIEATEALRSMLDEPYVFVYMPENYRKDSRRLPKVLNEGSFQYHIEKVLKNSGIYNDDGTPLHCTSRMIRAEVGRAMFAAGMSSDEVARKLGNTPSVAGKHYNTQYPSDEARKYNQLYNDTIVKSIERSLADASASPPDEQRRQMYGTCNATYRCVHPNDCLTCPERIVCANHPDIIQRK